MGSNVEWGIPKQKKHVSLDKNVKAGKGQEMGRIQKFLKNPTSIRKLQKWYNHCVSQQIIVRRENLSEELSRMVSMKPGGGCLPLFLSGYGETEAREL